MKITLTNKEIINKVKEFIKDKTYRIEVADAPDIIIIRKVVEEKNYG